MAAGRSVSGFTPVVLPAYVPPTPAEMPIWAQGTLRQTCDIFRPLVDADSDGGGTPGNRGWMVVARGVPYYHGSTRNFSEPALIGRMLQPSSISVELGWFLPGTPLQDGDVIRHTTTNGALTGNVYRMLGAPTAFDGVPVSDAAHMYCELRQEPHPPAGLPD